MQRLIDSLLLSKEVEQHGRQRLQALNQSSSSSNSSFPKPACPRRNYSLSLSLTFHTLRHIARLPTFVPSLSLSVFLSPKRPARKKERLWPAGARKRSAKRKEPIRTKMQKAEIGKLFIRYPFLLVYQLEIPCSLHWFSDF